MKLFHFLVRFAQQSPARSGIMIALSLSGYIVISICLAGRLALVGCCVLWTRMGRSMPRVTTATCSTSPCPYTYAGTACSRYPRYTAYANYASTLPNPSSLMTRENQWRTGTCRMGDCSHHCCSLTYRTALWRLHIFFFKWNNVNSFETLLRKAAYNFWSASPGVHLTKSGNGYVNAVATSVFFYS